MHLLRSLSLVGFGLQFMAFAYHYQNNDGLFMRELAAREAEADLADELDGFDILARAEDDDLLLIRRTPIPPKGGSRSPAKKGPSGGGGRLGHAVVTCSSCGGNCEKNPKTGAIFCSSCAAHCG